MNVQELIQVVGRGPDPSVMQPMEMMLASLDEDDMWAMQEVAAAFQDVDAVLLYQVMMMMTAGMTSNAIDALDMIVDYPEWGAAATLKMIDEWKASGGEAAKP